MTASCRNPFKAKLAGPAPQLGLWQGLGSAYTAEICATAGFDWLLFDGEHAPNHMPALLAQLQAVAAYPVHAVARVPVGEAWVLKQYLDVGFQTLLVPFVESAAEAEMLVQAVRYGPAGVRGMAPGLTRAARWGSIPSYLAQADQEICLLVQIESVAGFEQLDAIAAVDGVDGIFIGPADLSAAFGHRGEMDHPEMVERIVGAFRRIARAGKPAGTLALTGEAFQRARDEGCRFIATGTDVGLLARGATEMLRRLRDGAAPQTPTGY